MIFSKKLILSKTFDEDEKINCRNDLIIQCNDVAADEWRKKRKEKKNNKCRREVDGKREDEKNC